jgi:hypothetical protein
MSCERLSQSNTSSTHVGSALVTNTTTGQPLLSKHSPKKLPRGSKASSSSRSSVTTVTHSSPQLPESALDTQDSEMFSALIGHTRSLLPQGELEGLVSDDVGDFEHTPPPSNRASLDMSRGEAEKPAASKRLETSPDTTSRHRLHKISLNGLEIASKNKHVSPASIPSSKTKSSMLLAGDLNVIPGPPYHKSSLSQNGSATDSICTKPLMLSQDIRSSKGTVALAELSASIKPMETSRDEPQVCPSTQNSSNNSNDAFVGGG